MNGEGYRVGAWITGVITFFGSWIYAMASYGFFLGVGLGWIPSLVIAFLAALLWPLIAAALVLIVLFFLFVATR